MVVVWRSDNKLGSQSLPFALFVVDYLLGDGPEESLVSALWCYRHSCSCTHVSVDS